MAQLKSSNSNSTFRGFGVMRLMRKVLTSVAAITAVLVLAGTIMGLSGCSGQKRNDPVVSSSTQTSSQNQTSTTATPVAVSEKPAVTTKKKPAVRRARTVAYSSSTYGVSFKFPGEFALTTPGGNDQKSSLPESVPTNFVQPGGVTLATVELPSGSATTFFSVGANKNLNAEQCQQFLILQT